MAVALYARVSTTRQAENELSIPDQLRQLREWCLAQGKTIAAEYVEPGASAMDDRRQIFQEMIADATQAPIPFEAIIVHSLSRFFRDSLGFALYERKLGRAGIKVISITQQTSDDPAGEMARRIFNVFDEYQSKENAKHTLRAMKENARQGYWNGSRPPFGYRVVDAGALGNRGRRKRKLEIDPLEAETVRRIFDLYLYGANGKPLGMKTLAAYLNRHGITMRGKLWRIQKVNEVLADTAYIGHHHFNVRDSKTGRPKPETEWVTMGVPAIIEPHIFERVKKRRVRSNPKMNPPRGLTSPALLTGLLKCGHCGSGMVQASGKGGRYRYYKCTTRMAKDAKGCDGRNLPREKTDLLVISALAEKVFTPSRVSVMLKELAQRQTASRFKEEAKLAALKKDLDNATKGLDRLYQAVETGVLAMDDTLRDRSQQLQATRNEILAEIANLEDRRQIVLDKVDSARIDSFCEALKARMSDSQSRLGKAYLGLLVDEIRLEGDEIKMRGGYGRLADAIGQTDKLILGEVPSHVMEWRPRQDSNLRPPD